MSNEALIDQLSKKLRPVRARTRGLNAAVIGAICVIELVLFLLLGGMRPDMPHAMGQPSFWWKLAGAGAIALASGAAAIISFAPQDSPRRGLQLVIALLMFVLAAGWVIDELRFGWAVLAARLDWHQGIQCVYKMVLLAIPPVLGLGVIMRGGAPTDRNGSAWTVGIASASWGAFVFVFACPSDDPLYIAIWYSVGCGLVTLATRLILPPLTRW
ncbi:NrsF family protein [Lichenicoccus roseus]|uniref:DUF1109 domain-containing protein n=1 Tax=Lichenicoccus roseus TaxID=2683649 RepID=A0A5R9J547_9PROT|nr:DUF1109 domain-containing protein [Lichenicoccus roseus]TLU70741.1 DUF1109 domain-containing protein [Lichenicoccus roseus]